MSALCGVVAQSVVGQAGSQETEGSTASQQPLHSSLSQLFTAMCRVVNFADI